MTESTRQELIDFVSTRRACSTTKRYDEWNALFTDDAIYWVPLVPDQADGSTTPRTCTRTSCCATCASSG